MFKSFSIKNFRCFRDFTIEPLERVNLIAGMNNAGKTALLEAIFLHIGPNKPKSLLRVNALRGIPVREIIDVEDVWGWVFFNKHTEETIELTSLDRDSKRRSLRIRLAEPRTSTIMSPDKDDNEALNPGGLLTIPDESPELILEYQNTVGKTKISRAFITSDGEIKAKRAQLAPYPYGIFLSTHARLPKGNAKFFSKLDGANRIKKEVLPTMKILEPRLCRLALLEMGGVSIIHGDIGIGQLVPLPLMGEGVVRLCQIVLAIANYPNGIVLIDEIENGLHHSVMINVWKAIAQAARQSNVQLFVTTHSWECILAAHVAFQQSETYDFRLHRLDRIDDEIKSVTYDQEMLATASDSDLEVR